MDSNTVYQTLADDRNHPLFADPRLTYPGRRKRQRVLLIRLYVGVVKAGNAGALKMPLAYWLAYLHCRESTWRNLLRLLVEGGAATWEEDGTFAWAQGVLPEAMETPVMATATPETLAPSDPTAAERQRRHREREKEEMQRVDSAAGNGHQAEPVTAVVTVPVTPEVTPERTDIYIDISNPDSLHKKESDIYISAWQDVCNALRAKVATDRQKWTEEEIAEALFRLEGRALQPAGRLAYFRSVLTSVREENRAGQGKMTLLTPVVAESPPPAPAPAPAPHHLSNAECEFVFVQAEKAEQEAILTEARVHMRERNREVYAKLQRYEQEGEVPSRLVAETLTASRNEVIRARREKARKAG